MLLLSNIFIFFVLNIIVPLFLVVEHIDNLLRKILENNARTLSLIDV